MKISIQSAIVEAYPNYKMGLIKIISTNQNSEKLHSYIKYNESLADKDTVKKEWIKIFSDMHASERRLPSVIALWNIIDRFGELKPINYFVDAYNFISTKHGIPMGGYDITKLPDNNLTLQHVTPGGIKFQPMGLSGQLEKLKDPAEIAYYCGDTPVCRYWNNKDSDLTKIDDDTSEALIMFDALCNSKDLEKAMDEFVNLIKDTSVVNEIKTDILHKEKLTCSI